MKIGVLTSSRADYGIYKPLLSKLSQDNRFDLFIIAFGMHLQPQHGNTIAAIENDDFGIIHKVKGMPTEDSVLDISKGYGEIIVEFSEYWYTNKFDYVFALGDRFEMSAAVQSGIPYEISFIHIHGGETTLGAVDNVYRHQITLASKIHFTATDFFAERVKNIIGDSKNVFSVGSLSLDNLEKVKLPKWTNVCDEFNIPITPFILVTFHPETVNIEQNIKYIDILKKSLSILSQNTHIVITLANADSNGSLYRGMAFELKNNKNNNITLIDSFGKINYFSAMKNCLFLLGNTSSGIIEAASFNKYVLNVGNRQKGRLKSKNTIDIPFSVNKIISNSIALMKKGQFHGVNIYKKENTSINIIEKILEI
ncbi:UDP-N-acetylglucosamine 2-epimerase [Polaribacter uvawellassae]|uniref:UDP-N-acetylglucosamine 2-epimerase n=1 Tax=Polaribacter uvawellassae TaxID=3133495 RepID=UPI003219A751